MAAMELGDIRKRVVKISTGSKQFDSIPGGPSTASKEPPEGLLRLNQPTPSLTQRLR